MAYYRNSFLLFYILQLLIFLRQSLETHEQDVSKLDVDVMDLNSRPSPLDHLRSWGCRRFLFQVVLCVNRTIPSIDND